MSKHLQGDVFCCIMALMGSASTVYENYILDAILGDGAAASMPATVYVGLYTAEPSDGGGGTEVLGSGYARVAVTNDTTNWPAATSGEKRNGTKITFPQATGAWGDVNWFGLFDASTGGNLIIWGNLQNTSSPTAGDTPFFSVGGLVVRID